MPAEAPRTELAASAPAAAPSARPSDATGAAPCVSPLDRAIAEGASAAPGTHPALTGFADLTLPADEAQYRALNGYAILAVSVLAASEKRLPVVEVVFAPTPKAEPTVLPRIFPRDAVRPRTAVDSSKDTLGAFRQDLFLFVPIRFLHEHGSLVARFKAKKHALPLLTTPLELRLPFKERAGEIDESRLPDPQTVVRLVFANYCIGR
jgi:hypothetical protein